MLKVEDLTLETMIVPSIIPGIAKLLQNSPGLKMVKLDIVNNNTIPVYLPMNLFFFSYCTLDHNPKTMSSLFLLFLIHIDKVSLNSKFCMKTFYVLQDLNRYLDVKGLDQNQCWKLKDLDFSTSVEPKLMTSFMEFLVENARDDNLSQYNW